MLKTMYENCQALKILSLLYNILKIF